MKRAFEIIVSLFGLLLLSPLLIALVVVVWGSVGSPVFFKQLRPGMHGRPFTMVKFRTMNPEKDRGGRLLSDDERISRIGAVLRRTSLDELPELWNVLIGNMSLVGPRPLLLEYLPLYSAVQSRRHEVRPGITGWAQVNGRNAVSWEQRFAMDVWYVDNASFLLDLRILWMTVRKVLAREGIAQDGHATMPRFTGTGAGTNGR